MPVVADFWSLMHNVNDSSRRSGELYGYLTLPAESPDVSTGHSSLYGDKVMGNRTVSLFAPVLIATSLAITGCTSLCDAKYEMTQKVRTCKAWYEYDSECLVTGDYKHGWKAGYYDVITGGTGCPPVIAPHKYWTPPVFTQYDPSRRDDWYRGFADGAACAKCEPELHYLQTFMPPRHGHVHPATFSKQTPSVPSVPESAAKAVPGMELSPAPMPSSVEEPAPAADVTPAEQNTIVPAPDEKRSPTEQYNSSSRLRHQRPNPAGKPSLTSPSTFRTPPIRVRAAADEPSMLRQLVANNRQPNVQ